MNPNLKELYIRMLHYKDKPISQSTTDKGAMIIKFAVKRNGFEKFSYYSMRPITGDTVILNPYNILSKKDADGISKIELNFSEKLYPSIYLLSDR